MQNSHESHWENAEDPYPLLPTPLVPAAEPPMQNHPLRDAFKLVLSFCPVLLCVAKQTQTKEQDLGRERFVFMTFETYLSDEITAT